MLLLEGRIAKVISFLLIFSLFFTFTNKVYLCLSFAAFAPLVLSYAVLRYRSLVFSPFTLSLFSITLFFAICTLGYDPGAFSEFQFYRRDGNFFIAFLPLLVVAPLAFRCKTEQVIKYFLIVSAAASSVAMVEYLIYWKDIWDAYYLYFHGHNAAGGFLAAVTSIAIVFFLKKKSLPYFLLLVIVSAALIATKSRGSILGLGAACFMIFFLKKPLYRKLYSGGLCAATIIITAVAYLSLLNTQGDPRQIDENIVATTIHKMGSRSWTVADRALNLWPKALDLFIESPIIGTGFGSYNDVPYHLVSKAPLVKINDSGNYIYSNAHAHHTFLHVLAECGIVGLGILVYFLRQMYKEILSFSDGVVKQSLILCFWMNVFSSLTEHRFFSPSQVLPFTILLALAIADKNYGLAKTREIEQRLC